MKVHGHRPAQVIFWLRIWLRVSRKHMKPIDIESKRKAGIIGFLAPDETSLLFKIGHTGLEPVNYGFRVRCLTNLANAQ